MTWTSSGFLWLLLAVPLVWLASLVARTSFNPRQRVVQAGIRSVLLVALVLALARPVISTSSSQQSIVHLVDVSHSISGRAIEEAADRIEDLNAAIAPAHSRIVAFARGVTTMTTSAELRTLAAVDRKDDERSGLDRAGTDLEAALLAARGELAPEHVPRIVLFTDGRPTAGDTSAAIARLAADRIPVSAFPLQSRTIGDTWIESLELPERATAGATFPATITVSSQREGIALVELLDGDVVLASSRGPLERGTTPIALEGVIGDVGARLLEARVTMDGDPLNANDSLSRELWADPRAKVLYIERTRASARYLSGALRGAGFDVTVQAPSALPQSVADLEPWDVVILSDINRASMSDAAMIALADWVEKSGGGLLVAGGEAVFGERGYRETPIERLTPVTFERRDEPEVALVIVLDRSWSMAGSSIELTKVAAQAAVDVLSDEQLVGILTFNDKFAWDVTLRNVGKNRDVIRSRIAAIGPSGHTLIYPAVEQAYLALRDAKARARHVILLSDGRSYPGEYEALVRKMVGARMTLSTVAVGPSADPELLQNLAAWGKGRAYVVADATQVPEIFVKEAKNAATPAFDEKAITPVVKTPGFLSGIDLSRMPALKGRTATVLKEDAMELLATDDEDPLLAFWPIGLGRTAVFASDVKDRWAAEWVRWRGYGPFFASVIRALQRQRTPPLSLEVTEGPVRGDSRTLSIAVEAREPDGGYRNLLDPVLHVQSGARATPARVTAGQVAPGRYAATVLADVGRPLTIRIEGATAGIGVTSRTIVPDLAAEYRFGPPNEALLRSIASATGGTYRPEPAAQSGASSDTRMRRRALWPALVTLALCLWFLDLLFRRVRVFELGATPS